MRFWVEEIWKSFIPHYRFCYVLYFLGTICTIFNRNFVYLFLFTLRHFPKREKSSFCGLFRSDEIYKESFIWFLYKFFFWIGNFAFAGKFFLRNFCLGFFYFEIFLFREFFNFFSKDIIFYSNFLFYFLLGIFFKFFSFFSDKIFFGKILFFMENHFSFFFNENFLKTIFFWNFFDGNISFCMNLF